MATVPHRLPSMRRDSVSATRCVGSPGTLGAFAFTSASVGIGDGLGLGFACAARSAGAPKTMMLRDNIRKVSFPEREKSKSERGTRPLFSLLAGRHQMPGNDLLVRSIWSA